jgi:hypothetical protein
VRGKAPNRHGTTAAEAAQYALRSSFYYRQAAEFARLVKRVKSVARRARCDWTSVAELGIAQAAWDQVTRRRIPPETVFCHPVIVTKIPASAEYYRSVAALPQKGLTRLLRHGSTAVTGKGGADAVVNTCRVINAHLSALIEAEPSFSLELALKAAYMNFGAQTNGSWRTRIGAEGAATVNELIVNYLVGQGLAATFRLRDGAVARKVEAAAEDIQQVELINQYTILFGSEPDVSIRNKDGILEVAIEVKAGLDPAGALERYGACKKSFDRALDENKSAATLYLACCLTPTVEKAIAKDRLVKRSFDLAAILSEPKARADFLAHLRWLLHL